MVVLKSFLRAPHSYINIIKESIEILEFSYESADAIVGNFEILLLTIIVGRT
jgi:hypothetical protein